MNNTSIKFKAEYRKNLYFNEYTYRSTIDISDIQRLRYYSSYSDYENHTTAWNGQNKPLPNKDMIERYFDYKNNHSGNARVRIEYGKIIIYTNEISDLKSAIDHIQPTGKITFFTALVPSQPDTIEFSRPPKYKYRNYFKAKVISDKLKMEILSFINDQRVHGAEVDVNDAMYIWLNQPTRNKNGTSYLSESYYIEYDDDIYRSLLSLKFADILKPKVFTLVQRS